ncbi:hypothetical protein [Vibrio intestinalis]|uniref:hypothetical protein n=1 Tax=Vibrio intestinalis TaxID=2933291 RepID=UPI0021A8E193|nr:hypothetical protein [Vibrio intestinalis]
MNDKSKTPIIAEAVEVDGVYQAEQRSGKDRRKNRTTKWRFYERRHSGDPRLRRGKTIDEEI